MSAPVLVFDLETVPDADALRRLHQLPGDLSDEQVIHWAQQQRRAQVGHDFMPPHLQRIVAIGCVLRWDAEKIKVWCLGDAHSSEAELIQQFFDGIGRSTPQLVSWNGGGFDLPVLHYRAMRHGIQAARYWDMGEHDREFRYNNYVNRYHTRHLDLMECLAMFQSRNNVPLDELAQLCGFPGKLGMDGSQVWSAYYRGELEAIRAYCCTDVVNTYLLYVQFQLMRGEVNRMEHEQELQRVRAYLQNQNQSPWPEFLAAWPARPTGE